MFRAIRLGKNNIRHFGRLLVSPVFIAIALYLQIPLNLQIQIWQIKLCGLLVQLQKHICKRFKVALGSCPST
jgi:hypothetical protein